MSVNGRRRVVVTGVGAVTPLGNDAETFWTNLTAGESGAAEIQQFDPSEFAVHFACELKDFDPTKWIEYRKARKIDRFAQMIIAAARMAEEDSGLDIAAETDRVGASVATGIGGLKAFQDCYDQRLGRADVMLAGGTEAGITKVGIGGFGAMRALSRRNEAPAKASRPFDAERDGFVMGEAGGVLLLQGARHA